MNWGRPEDEDAEEEPAADQPRRRWWHVLGAGWPVRVIVAVLALAISTGLASRSPLPIVADQTLARDLTTGAFSVMLLGMINAALAETL